ncbi:transcriptional regulator MntR [Clostridium polynesiense]|uniref:transcriptional regulator MntR n=1 Tax=Clostridium polynesiense TaxID=1325933 RepID=UPI00058C1B03|nr:transcriptional regulator MntR [Clostridium polynesiense]
MEDKTFHTFTEYLKKDSNSLTPSMEDYLEMIYRLSLINGFARVNELAEALNVQPPSCTKMVQKLSEAKFIKYEKYGVIILTPYGNELGNTLLERHNITEKFLRLINVKEENILTETEKIEHTLSLETFNSLKSLVEFLSDNPNVLKEFYKFLSCR